MIDMTEYQERPTDCSKEVWEAFVAWFLSIPDVDESLLLPNINGRWESETMMSMLCGFYAAYEINQG